MKKIGSFSRYLLVGVCLTIFATEAQGRQTGINVNEVEIQINSIAPPFAVWFYLRLDFQPGYSLDIPAFNPNNPGLTAEAVSETHPNMLAGVVTTLRRRGDGIAFEVTGLTRDFLELYQQGVANLFIEVSANVVIQSVDGAGNTERNSLLANTIREKTGAITLTADQVQELITSRGGEFRILENTIDFGVNTQENGAGSNDVFLTFSYGRPWTEGVFMNAKGRVSTNAKDSLNFIYFYPLNVPLLRSRDRAHQLTGQAGIEGNQKFSTGRFTANFFYEGIIPNFINLSYGHNRLRLKPVLKAGVKFYTEFENNRGVMGSNEDSNQLFGELYYFIPVLKNYSLIVNVGAFYDFDSDVNPSDDISFNYDIALGVDIPNTEFKTIFKYSNGENDVNYMDGEILQLGLIMNIFEQGIEKR